MIGFYIASHKAIGKLCLNYKEDASDGHEKKIKTYNLQKAGMTQKQDDKGALDRPTGFGSLEESK